MFDDLENIQILHLAKKHLRPVLKAAQTAGTETQYDNQLTAVPNGILESLSKYEGDHSTR